MKDTQNNAANSSAAKTINDMNAGWRNEVANKLGMDPKTFQLAQGTLGLQTSDSGGLFLMADAVPPASVVAYYDPSGKNKRSTAYNELLHAMLPATSSGLQGALGPMYAKWLVYRSADTSDLTQQELFKKWAGRHLDPGKVAAALTVFKMAASDPLNLALDNYVDKSNYTTVADDTGSTYPLPTYSCDISTAKTAINTGGSASIDYESSTADTTSTGTTVSGSASGFYEIFSGGVGGSFDQLNQTAASSSFSIKGRVGKYALVPSNAAAWYDGSLVSRAFNAQNDNNIWDPNANMGDWKSFFGPDGSLARRVSDLLLVSDYDLTVTSAASYSTSDFTKIQANAKFGIWPFFESSASTTHTQTMTHNSNGTISVNYKLNKGLIAIWGANIQDAPN